MRRAYSFLFFLFFMLVFASRGYALVADPLTTIELKSPIHFLAADGSDLEVHPGTYEVEGTDNEIRLIPEGDVPPILLSAQQTPFPEEVDAPVAMAIPIENEGVYIAWLQPGKKGVEAIGSYSPIQKRGINLFKIPGRLTSRHISQLRSFGKQLADSPTFTPLKNDWTQVVKDITRQKDLRNSANVNEMVMLVMRESIVEQNKDKQYWLKKLQTYNAMQKELSQYLEDLHNKAKKLAGTEKAKIEQLIRSNEKKLATVGDDAQLANIDLQNALQKSQQLLQLMSSISKQLHDTAMAIIRKLG